MDGVVGGAAGGHQCDDGVDDGAFVDQMTERTEVVAQCADFQRTHGGRAGQRITQRQLRVDERRARQLHAHRFQQYLVGIGGAVEGAGARAVIRGRFGFQQFFAGGFASGVTLADFGLLLVRNARRHRPGRYEYRRQMTERQCADQQAWHDLVAHAQIDGGIEHVMAQADGRGLGNDVAREQRQLHAATALGDAVAHRRHGAGNLRGGADFARGLAHQFRVMLERLVCRQHVVVGGDDAQVGRHITAQPALVGRPAGSEGMRQVAAAQARPERAFTQGGIDARQISRARRSAALADAFSDGVDFRMHGSMAANGEWGTGTAGHA
ncbi:hypothetical protein D3C81_873900 [compost metagenome]